jgi:hypothetical protein
MVAAGLEQEAEGEGGEEILSSGADYEEIDTSSKKNDWERNFRFIMGINHGKA